MPQNYIGCDLCKDRLDVFDPVIGHATAHANSAAGIKTLFKACGPDSILIFEATSGCDQALLKALAKAGRPFVRLNPLHAWHFAQSLNLPKTVSPMIRADICASLKALAARIARFEAEIADHLARHPDLARDAQLLRSIPGIGPVTAANLLARLPELGHLDRRAIASLAGLAPKARESGKYRGKRRVGQGREVVRRLLYMSALSLWRTPGPATTALRRMQDAGKPSKVILIAMARKIVTIANAVLRDQTPFRTNAQT